MKKLSTLSLTFIFVFITMAWVCSTVHAQTIDEIISKYHESMGGLDKLKALKSIKLSGKMPTPMGDFSMVIFKKFPNLTKTEMDIQGQLMVQAFDGETAWMINPMMGSTEPQKLEGEMAKSIIDQSEFEDPFIDYAAKGHEVSLEGDEIIEGVECYKIKLVMNQNNDEDVRTQFYFLDKELYLPLLVKTRINDMEINTYMSDYQEVDEGLIVAFNIEVRMEGQPSQMISIDSVEVNIEMDDGFFRFPASE
jgi:outer membrane lipoprotein-sorting protein